MSSAFFPEEKMAETAFVAIYPVRKEIAKLNNNRTLCINGPLAPI
jgi:hypothetical protein